jgi:hypothetical protein
VRGAARKGGSYRDTLFIDSKATFIFLFCVVSGICLGGAAAVVMAGTIQTPAFYTGSLIGATVAFLCSPLFLTKMNNRNIFPAMVISFVLTFPVAVLTGLTGSPWTGIGLTAISIFALYYGLLIRNDTKDEDVIFKWKGVYVVPLLCLLTAGVIAYRYDPLPDDIPALIEMLGDNNMERHTAAGRKLLNYGKTPFLTALQHHDARVRATAAQFLGTLGDSSVQNELVKASKDLDPHVRMWVAFSLGKIGDSHALETLHQLAADSERIVRSEADRAIEEIKRKR